jgi:hypothetical protein
MRTFAIAILLFTTIPALASGPRPVVKSEPKPPYDGIKGNLVGWQAPKIRLPAPPFISSRELIMLLRPDVEIANRLFGGLNLPRSGFSRAADEALEAIRGAILPSRWDVLETFDLLQRLRPLR